MFHKLKQFNDLRKKANALKSKLAEEKITIDNRATTIVMDGNQEVKEVTVKNEYLTPDKKQQLELQLRDGMNEAVKKAQRVMASKMREMGEFNIPGLS